MARVSSVGILRWVWGEQARLRHEHWLGRLRDAGLDIGEDVFLPESTYIDLEFCPLIRIGNSCGFGAQVMLLAHDGQARRWLGADRVGPVTLHDSCHLGARTIVLPGVTIGPRTVVAACSVVDRTLPPDTFCAGNPARPWATLQQYLAVHRARIAEGRNFQYEQYEIRALTPERRAELVAAIAERDAYMIGGRSAELAGRGGTPRTSTVTHVPTSPSREP